MKKIMSLFLSAAMVLGLSGCGSMNNTTKMGLGGAGGGAAVGAIIGGLIGHGKGAAIGAAVGAAAGGTPSAVAYGSIFLIFAGFAFGLYRRLRPSKA